MKLSKQRKEEIARKFHDLYEKLAPKYGYETKEETKQFDPNSPNGKLMMEVCGTILDKELEAERMRIIEEIDGYNNPYITEQGKKDIIRLIKSLTPNEHE